MDKATIGTARWRGGEGWAWLLGFIALDLYANYVPRLVGFAIPAWLAYVAGFFLLVAVVCRFGLGLGATDLGLHRPKGWLRWLALGFAVGFGLWGLKNLAFLAMGKFDIVGWRDATFAVPMLGQALLGMLLASGINDVLVRGYGLAVCRRFGWMRWYVPLTALVYALDDTWNGGFDAMNLAFSFVLGLSLAYTVLRTGALWMSIGIHWVGNVFYRFMSGFDGQGVPVLEQVVDGAGFEVLSIAVTALLLPLLVLTTRAWAPSRADAIRR